MTSIVPQDTADGRALATASLDRTRNGVTSDQDGTLVSIGVGVFLTAGHVLFQFVNPDEPSPADVYHINLSDGLPSPRVATVGAEAFASSILNFGWGLSRPDLAAVVTGDENAPRNWMSARARGDF